MAVYTKVTGRQIRGFLKDYSIGTPKSLIAIDEGVENSNYLLETVDSKYILTLFERRVTEKDIPFYLNLMNHLADNKIPCPRSIINNNGTLIGDLSGKKATIVTFLEARQSQDITWMQCQSAGKMLAQIHHKASSFNSSKPNDFGVPSFRELFNKIEGDLNKIQPGLRNKIINELNFIEKEWSGFSSDDLPTGLIHGDYFPDNVFFQWDIVRGVIDYYFSCKDFYLYDLAIAINAWCWTGKEINSKKMAAFIEGYEIYRILNEAEKDAFPAFIRAATMRFFLTRAIDMLTPHEDAINTPKDPLEYFNIMEFHQSKKSLDDYGIK
jgi:homoserine kinase type II